MNRLAPVVVLSADAPDATAAATCAYDDPATVDSQACSRAAADYAIAYSNTGQPCPGYDPTKPLPNACPPGKPVATYAQAEATQQAAQQQCLSQSGQQSSVWYDECQRMANEELAREVRALNAQRQASARPADGQHNACPPLNRTRDEC
jgi:hypothetical protein